MTGDLESSLNAASKALEQGDYSSALASLKAVCYTLMNTSAQVGGQIERLTDSDTSDISHAIAFCQLLTHSTNPQVKQWAISVEAQLRNLQSTEPATTTLPESDLTGFVAFDSPTSEVRSQESEVRSQNSEFGINDSPSLPLSPSPPAPLPKGRQVERSQRLSIPSLNLIPFWLLQLGSAIALFCLLRELLNFAMAFTNDLLVFLPYLEPFQPFYHDHTRLILLSLLLLMSLSPWLLDAILRLFYGFQPLSIDTLTSHSPEASRLLQRYCQQRNWSLPQLAIVPTSAPLAITYGNLPRTARIVVSQGLLEQLADDEIATIYAAQLAHIAHGDFIVMSLFMLVTGLPYIFYWQVSQWGDKTANEILRVIAAVLANFAYGLWFVLSIPALWLSQSGIYMGDRASSEITGNPNGLVRAILKIAQGIAQNIQQQQHTSWLLESWNLFTLVSYHQAITISSLHTYSEIEAGLAWDCLNPVRYWLNLNNTHPLIGDRLQRLTHIAHQQRLEPELNLSRQGAGGLWRTVAQGQRGTGEILIQNPKSKIQNSPSPQPPAPSPFLLQIAPYLGIFLGFALGGFMWLLGAIGTWLKIAQLAWMWGDRGIMVGCLPIGLSIGIFIRINNFFPDIKPATSLNNPSLTDLLANPTALPINSQTVTLQGKLLGRRGISNWLGQDLILHLPTGLIKLHHVSRFGAVGDLLLRSSTHPTDLLGRYLFTIGWFRRGANAWIDIDTLRTGGGKISPSGHPVWSTLLASFATAWGVYLIVASG